MARPGDSNFALGEKQLVRAKARASLILRDELEIYVMSKKKSLMSAVMAGLLLGGAQSAQAVNPGPGDHVLTQAEVHPSGIYLALDRASCNGKDGCQAKSSCKGKDLHSCKGKNSCKGKGGCKSASNDCAGKNSCKGKGGCATAKHDCKGKNNCKAQGGCKSGDNGCAAKNSCKGKGGCASPVNM